MAGWSDTSISTGPNATSPNGAAWRCSSAASLPRCARSSPALPAWPHLRYRTFAAYNAAGGAVWAVGFVLLGYAAGTGWRRVEHIAGRASLLLLLVVAVVGAIVLGGPLGGPPP